MTHKQRARVSHICSTFFDNLALLEEVLDTRHAVDPIVAHRVRSQVHRSHGPLPCAFLVQRELLDKLLGGVEPRRLLRFSAKIAHFAREPDDFKVLAESGEPGVRLQQ